MQLEKDARNLVVELQYGGSSPYTVTEEKDG
jgi:hypothetical protein